MTVVDVHRPALFLTVDRRNHLGWSLGQGRGIVQYQPVMPDLSQWEDTPIDSELEPDIRGVALQSCRIRHTHILVHSSISQHRMNT